MASDVFIFTYFTLHKSTLHETIFPNTFVITLMEAKQIVIRLDTANEVEFLV